MPTNTYVKTTGSDGNDGLSWETAKLTIQAGISIIDPNGTVWVDDGTYYENIIIGANITVRSKNNNPLTAIINGGWVRACATIDITGWIVGFTCTNGVGEPYGGGTLAGGGIRGGNALNCILDDNYSDFGGGAAETSLLNCILSNNTAYYQGGGAINCNLSNCFINSNQVISQGGGGIRGGTLINCLINGNTAPVGGGAWLGDLTNCTLSENVGGGTNSSTLRNCISWNNDIPDDFSGGGSETYSCGEGYVGLGSITLDPAFIGSGSYRLQSSSPCIDIGNNAYVTVGEKDLDDNDRIYPVGGTVDMGAYEWNPQSSSSSASSLSSISTSSSSSSSSSISSLSTISSFSSISSLSSQSSSSSSESSESSSSTSSLSTQVQTTSSSSVSEEPSKIDSFFTQWSVSAKDHLSTEVHYEIEMSDNAELNSPIIKHNTKLQTQYFHYDPTGTGKHFIGFPSVGLNMPDRGTIIRYQYLKENIQDVFVRKNNVLYRMSPDISFAIDSISLENINGSKICSDVCNENLWILSSDKMAYTVPKELKIDNITSLYLNDNVLAIKIDGSRQNLWQIEKIKIKLTNLHNEELASINLPQEIKEVVDACVMNNTGNLFFIAKSDYATSGTFLISYSKSGNEIIIVDAIANNFSQWGAFNALFGDGTSILKKFERGLIENIFDFTSQGITVDIVASKTRKCFYILDRNNLILSKINYLNGHIIWQSSIPSTLDKDNLLIKHNNNGNYIYFWSGDLVGAIEDTGKEGLIRGYMNLNSDGDTDFGLIRRNNSHAWVKHNSI